LYNLYSKKATTQGYDSQNVVQVIQANCTNTESKCNFCDGKIYWNPCVIHRHTKKKLPLSKPFTAHGTSPVPHRGCIYNSDNFYSKIVIHEDDSKFVKAKKMSKQDEWVGRDESGLTYVERLIRDRTPEEVEHYNEFLKHCTDYTYDSKQQSGMDPKKMLAGVRPRKR
jgi:hypothetical protein